MATALPDTHALRDLYSGIRLYPQVPDAPTDQIPDDVPDHEIPDDLSITHADQVPCCD